MTTNQKHLVVIIRIRVNSNHGYGFMCYQGLILALPGPTLLDLRAQTNTSTEEISTIFTGRSLGYLVGSILGGMMFDRVNQACLLGLSLMLTSAATAVVPWCRQLIWLIGIMSMQGLSMGFLDTGKL